MIQPTSNFHGYNRTDAFSGVGNKATPAQTNASSADQAGGDRLSSASTDALRQALGKTPEIRPDVVAKGKALAVDPNYPPREIIARLAEILVQAPDQSA